MADDKSDDEVEVVEAAQLSKQQQAEAGAMSNVGGAGDEKEIAISQTTVADTMRQLDLQALQEAMEARKREQALRAVVVKAEDVVIVADQFMLTPEKAERALREFNGDLRATLQGLVDAK
eukprot:TRINITY_DN5123_c0_g1_i1.p1 TRINITY_DN5123_c0_g1~~TRINITY_DN5123_c0_g1_i1.p1  ORF type:complete len:120 (+),score=35.91 TRINITY_DN5123_c0_g1_i1:57-416(+)